MKCCNDYFDRENLKVKTDQMLGYASDAKQYAQKLGNYTAQRAQSFSVLDFAILQTCLISLGLWMGATFAKGFKKMRGFLFAAFAASWVYLFWRVFISEE